MSALLADDSGESLKLSEYTPTLALNASARPPQGVLDGATP